MPWYRLDSASLVTGWLMVCSYELCQSTPDPSTCLMLSKGVHTTHSLLKVVGYESTWFYMVKLCTIKYIISLALSCGPLFICQTNCGGKTRLMFSGDNIRIRLVLHNISIYRIDIECEPKTDYEQCLNQHRITSEIDNQWQNRQKSVWIE